MPAPAAIDAVPMASASTPSRCFGDSPPAMLAQQARPQDLFATGEDVLWASGGAIHRMDVATGRASTLDATHLTLLKAADSHDVFGVDGQATLWAIDLSSGRARVIARGNAWVGGEGSLGAMMGVALMFPAEYAVDSDYVYAAWRQNQASYGYYSQGDRIRTMKGPHDLGFIGRVKRDGTSPPEYVGPGPDEHFIVSDGYAYWASRFEGMKRRRLIPGAANELVLATPDVPFAWTLGVASGRLYVAMPNPPPPAPAAGAASRRTVSIGSVPVEPAEHGQAPQLRVHLHSASLPMWFPAIADGRCVYTGGPGGVTRASLDDGKIQQLIEGHSVPGDATVFSSRFLASDGRYLYWADHGGDRVVRWSR